MFPKEFQIFSEVLFLGLPLDDRVYACTNDSPQSLKLSFIQLCFFIQNEYPYVLQYEYDVLPVRYTTLSGEDRNL